MGFSFKELVVRDPTVKTDHDSDTRFRSYDFLKKFHMEFNAYGTNDACMCVGCAPFPDRTRLPY